MILCFRCREMKELAAFNLRRDYVPPKPHSYCKSCMNKNTAKWKAKFPEQRQNNTWDYNRSETAKRHAQGDKYVAPYKPPPLAVSEATKHMQSFGARIAHMTRQDINNTEIARTLNERGIKTPSDEKWNATKVGNVIRNMKLK